MTKIYFKNQIQFKHVNYVFVSNVEKHPLLRYNKFATLRLGLCKKRLFCWCCRPTCTRYISCADLLRVLLIVFQALLCTLYCS